MSIGSPDFAGNPAVDRLTSVLALVGQNIASGATYTSSLLNVAQYQSLQANYSETNSLYMGTAPRTVRFRFYADSAATILTGTQQFRVPSYGGLLYTRIPVLGPYVEIDLDAVATTTISSIDLYLYGSYRPAASVRALISNGIPDTLTASNGDFTGTRIYSGTITAGSSLSAWPPFWLGRARFHLRTGPVATTPCELAILDLVAVARMAGQTVPLSTGNNQFDFETILTGESWEARFINASSASVTISLAINYEGMLR